MARIAGLSICVACLLVPLVCAAQSDRQQPHTPRATSAVDLGRFEGFTEPSRELVVESYIDGVLETLHTKAGDTFEKDQPLVSLDDGMQALAVEVARLRSESRAEIRIAEARVAEAEVELESQQELVNKGSATDRNVRRAKAALDVARAELELAKENGVLAAKQLEIERERLALYTIRAPFDGQVLALAVQDGAEEGAALRQNDRIMHIASLDPIMAKISLPEPVVAQMRAGRSYTLGLGGDAHATHARLTRIAAQADRGSQLIEVVFEIENGKGALRSGMRCRLLSVDPQEEAASRE